jgi:hypothetical protein
VASLPHPQLTLASVYFGFYSIFGSPWKIPLQLVAGNALQFRVDDVQQDLERRFASKIELKGGNMVLGG